MPRENNRANNELRPLIITRNFIKYAEGSVLIEVGNTKIICTASVEEKIPPFLKDKTPPRGWITGEYSMLPRSTHTRSARESSKGKISGRTHEIQRLIGRAIRSVIDLEQLGPRTIWIDCDVIQADGGTRTASITGSMIAVYDAIQRLIKNKIITPKKEIIRGFAAAVSVGIVNGEEFLDLDYKEDSSAEVDMNIIMTDKKEIIELQGTAEDRPFKKSQMLRLLKLGEDGIIDITQIQKKCLNIVTI